jgi:hypothetical protein
MGINRAYKLLKGQVGSAEGWLRLLREHPLPNIPHVVYCPECAKPRMFGPLPAEEDISRCWNRDCGSFVFLFDEFFYTALSKFLKYSYRNDRSLFARVKAELPDLPFPKLEGVLGWVTTAWNKAAKPRGKPHETRTHLFIASWIESLSAPRFDLDVKEEGPPVVLRTKPLMSFVDALDLLRGDYPPAGRTLSTPFGRKRKFGGIDSETLRQIHEEFKRSALERFGVVPSLVTRDVQRIRRWKRRWRKAKHRIQGNKVREK